MSREITVPCIKKIENGSRRSITAGTGRGKKEKIEICGAEFVIVKSVRCR